MDIYIDNRQDVEVEKDIVDEMKRAIKVALGYEREPLDVEVSISLVDKEEIQNLNREFRGIDKVTDVLSFPIDEEFPTGIKILGDIIICTERAKEQALEYGHSFMREMVYLTVHSVLHLLGYDHLEDGEKEIMRSKEKDIMEELDIPRA